MEFAIKATFTVIGIFEVVFLVKCFVIIFQNIF